MAGQALDGPRVQLLERAGGYWPRDDEQQLRRAAALWRNLADTINQTRQFAHPAAKTIWFDSAGPTIEAIQRVWLNWSEDCAEGLEAHCRSLDAALSEQARAVAHTKTTVVEHLDRLARDLDTIKRKGREENVEISSQTRIAECREALDELGHSLRRRTARIVAHRIQPEQIQQYLADPSLQAMADHARAAATPNPPDPPATAN